MSTVSVTNLKNASSSVNNAVTTSGGDLTNAAGVSFMGGSKNLLYNGAMQVHQRGTSVSGITTVGGYRTADRWSLGSNIGGWTQSIESDAPTGSGLRKSLKMLCTTAQAAPGSGDFCLMAQMLEGQDVQRIAKGTASAQQLTLSFWVKANATGTYIAEIEDKDNSRSVSLSYTISASGAWEKKTVAIPADATGVLDNDNAASLQVNFWLGAGSGFTSGTLATSWATTVSANRAVGQTNLAAATNNYWQVTGVQLEVGPVATSFEFKSYQQELRECQRYYQRYNTETTYGPIRGMALIGENTVYSYGVFTFLQEMRATPTLTRGGSLRIVDAINVIGVNNVVIQTNYANRWSVNVQVTAASNVTAYRPYWMEASNDATAYVALSAEL